MPGGEWDIDPERLLILARAGDGPALGQLLELYRSYLALLARVHIGRRLQGKVDAADLVQETFLRVYQAFDQFRGTTEPEFVSWLRQILASRLGDLVRRYYGARRRDVRLERELDGDMERSSDELGDLAAPHSTPSQQAARREQAVILANALERLPDHYREVLILHHMEGCTLPEAGRRMGRTVASVEKLWARALAQLRIILGAPS